MSSNNRPWYKWFPKDFIADEKVQCLSPIAELIYRRALDVMWQANDCRLLNLCFKLAYALSRGLDENEFKKAWDEIQTPGFELFQISECGNWIYSKRLSEQMEDIEKTRKERQKAGRKGGRKSHQAKG